MNSVELDLWRERKQMKKTMEDLGVDDVYFEEVDDEEWGRNCKRNSF
ncbi:MAG: hypothetical protein WD512_03485 [Candidatus Paceibacterota bacterium]